MIGEAYSTARKETQYKKIRFITQDTVGANIVKYIKTKSCNKVGDGKRMSRMLKKDGYHGYC